MAISDAVCKTELKEAMRKLPKVGDNVDAAAVDANFGGLGAGVHSIFKKAETWSVPDHDGTFWAWIDDVTTWLGSLYGWQQGFVQKVNAWTPTSPSEQSFRAALLQLPTVAAPPQASPGSLRGKLQ